VKLAKFKGEFVWHKHDAEDELFLVIKGHLLIRLSDREIHLDAGEFTIIPRGVEHLPIAEEEAHVLLLEPKTTLNTGDVVNARTIKDLQACSWSPATISGYFPSKRQAYLERLVDLRHCCSP